MKTTAALLAAVALCGPAWGQTPKPSDPHLIITPGLTSDLSFITSANDGFKTIIVCTVRCVCRWSDDHHRISPAHIRQIAALLDQGTGLICLAPKAEEQSPDGR
jgi:hypothetical protein